MKTLFNFSAIAFLFIIGISCSSSDDPIPIPPPPQPTPSVVNPPVINTPVATIPDPAPTDVVITFKADLKPATGVTSMASGNATLELNQTAKTFNTNINFTGLKPGLAYIHGSDGAIVFNFFPERYIAAYSNPLDEGDWSPIPSPISYRSRITDDQITELMANHYYIDLRTQSYPNGEISGTLIKQ